MDIKITYYIYEKYSWLSISMLKFLKLYYFGLLSQVFVIFPPNLWIVK